MKRTIGLLVLLAGCPRDGADPDALPDTTAEDDPPQAPALILPPPDDVREAAEGAAGVAGLEASEPEVERIVTWDEDENWVYYLWSLDPDAAETPVPIEAHDVLLDTVPRAELASDGTLTVQWTTTWPAQRGIIYVGTRVEEDALALPRHRKAVTESLEGTATEHEASYSMGKLLTPLYDVSGMKERGWGEFVWRVEQPHPLRGTSRIHDGRTAFRIDEEGQFVQLPTVTLGPSVDQITTDSAVVWFETDVPTVASVAVGDHGPVVSTEPSTRHEFAVTGLEPDRTHVYQVGVSNGDETSITPYNTFETRPESGPLTVAMMSDSRSGAAPGLEAYGGVNAAVVHQLSVIAAREGAEAVFFPGDLIDGYTTEPGDFEWQLRRWFRAVEPIHGSLPFYTGIGNHEVLIQAWDDRAQLDREGDESAEAIWASMVVNPSNGPGPENDDAPPYDESVYSVDLGNTHFVMLNSNYWFAMPVGDPRFEGKGNREGLIMDGQLAWLEADLAAARERGVEHIVVMTHEPAFPSGAHRGDAMWWDNAIPEVNETRERFWRILSDNEVLAFFSGDEHLYARARIGPETVEGADNPVWHIVSGGCGAPYYAVDPPPEYADQYVAYSAQQHVTLWTFDGPRVELEVIGITGEVIETVTLAE